MSIDDYFSNITKEIHNITYKTLEELIKYLNINRHNVKFPEENIIIFDKDNPISVKKLSSLFKELGLDNNNLNSVLYFPISLIISNEKRDYIIYILLSKNLILNDKHNDISIRESLQEVIRSIIRLYALENEEYIIENAANNSDIPILNNENIGNGYIESFKINFSQDEGHKIENLHIKYVASRFIALLINSVKYFSLGDKDSFFVVFTEDFITKILSNIYFSELNDGINNIIERLKNDFDNLKKEIREAKKYGIVYSLSDRISPYFSDIFFLLLYLNISSHIKDNNNSYNTINNLDDLISKVKELNKKIDKNSYYKILNELKLQILYSIVYPYTYYIPNLDIGSYMGNIFNNPDNLEKYNKFLDMLEKLINSQIMNLDEVSNISGEIENLKISSKEIREFFEDKSNETIINSPYTFYSFDFHLKEITNQSLRILKNSLQY